MPILSAFGKRNWNFVVYFTNYIMCISETNCFSKDSWCLQDWFQEPVHKQCHEAGLVGRGKPVL